MKGWNVILKDWVLQSGLGQLTSTQKLPHVFRILGAKSGQKLIKYQRMWREVDFDSQLDHTDMDYWIKVECDDAMTLVNFARMDCFGAFHTLNIQLHTRQKVKTKTNKQEASKMNQNDISQPATLSAKGFRCSWHRTVAAKWSEIVFSFVGSLLRCCCLTLFCLFQHGYIGHKSPKLAWTNCRDVYNTLIFMITSHLWRIWASFPWSLLAAFIFLHEKPVGLMPSSHHPDQQDGLSHPFPSWKNQKTIRIWSIMS